VAFEVDDLEQALQGQIEVHRPHDPEDRHTLAPSSQYRRAPAMRRLRPGAGAAW
jgi:hypothetical protein